MPISLRTSDPVEVVASVQKAVRLLAMLGPASGELEPGMAMQPSGTVNLRRLIGGAPRDFPFMIFHYWFPPSWKMAQVRECISALAQTVASAGTAFRPLRLLVEHLLDDPIGSWSTKKERYQARGEWAPSEEYVRFLCNPVDISLLRQLEEAAKSGARAARQPWPDYSVGPAAPGGSSPAGRVTVEKVGPGRQVYLDGMEVGKPFRKNAINIIAILDAFAAQDFPHSVETSLDPEQRGYAVRYLKKRFEGTPLVFDEEEDRITITIR